MPIKVPIELSNILPAHNDSGQQHSHNQKYRQQDQVSGCGWRGHRPGDVEATIAQVGWASQNDAIVLAGPSDSSNRGLYIPRPVPTPTTTTYLILLAVFLVVAVLLARIIMRRKMLDSFIGTLIGMAIFLVLALIACVWFTASALHAGYPGTDLCGHCDWPGAG